ncbi:hypothetical protein D3C59_37345 [Streptomyces sp. SHP22-7]|nr:hypothetical protein D3C59_37345 [Streptomyces sp. SHP22-7]
MNDLSAVNVLLPGGAGAIVTLIVAAHLLKGHLVARSVLEDVRKDRDDRIAELVKDRDMWRDAHKESEVARIEAQNQAR